jgi:2-polyprenyl-3-methyl-5-hydroxy-6-metoxy-1,4-benzoquinol methylase
MNFSSGSELTAVQIQPASEVVETRLTATDVQLGCDVAKTPEGIRLRYQENRDWRLYPKEWIYRNITVKGMDVLDFGCGTGEITTQLAFLGAKQVWGLDVTPGLLRQTQRRAELDGVADRVQTFCGMIQDIEPHPVDVILAFAVLHHCFPLENLMPTLLRWLKPGGVFVATEPINYLPLLAWMRNHSGIPKDPLDEGERQLNGADVRYVASFFSQRQVVHFHVLGRLRRLWHGKDKWFRQIDQKILRVPMTSKFAGQAIIVCRR